MVECPDCGSEFDTSRGMRIHYGNKHEGYLPNNTCSRCSDSFYVESNSSRKYCDTCLDDKSGIRDKPDDIDLPDGKNWEELTSYQRYYYENREEEIERSEGKWAKYTRRKELRSWYKEIKESISCERCDESRSACLQFHHIEEKDHTISDMISSGMSRERIREEMDKCIVLCANCHMIEHNQKT